MKSQRKDSEALSADVRPSDRGKGESPPIEEELREDEKEDLLRQGAARLGISLSVGQVRQFMEYLALLRKWNRRLNLTARQSDSDIILKHFLDSLLPLPLIGPQSSLLDLGSGAGFPGVPLKIVRPSQPLTLVEASAKKTSFLKEVRRRLQLSGTTVLHHHLGQGKSPSFSTPFDQVITRAVGGALVLLKAVYPLLKPRGEMILMKGPKGVSEMEALSPRIREMGFSLNPPLTLTLPILEQERTLIVLTKE